LVTPSGDNHLVAIISKFMPTDSQVLASFRAIRSWSHGDRRAPHKPLLLLIALARLQRGEGRWLPFTEIEEPFRELLGQYGPEGSGKNPHYPFWRLRSDGIWEIPEADALAATQTSAGDVRLAELRSIDARGGLRADIYEHLRARPELANTLATQILEDAFPPSLHESILEAVGFPWVMGGRRRRDPRFREEILRIYERRCAVCGYDGRLGTADLAIEAAHIKWHAAGGPDTPENGLALCSFHHVALDRGAMSLDDSLRFLVSQHVNGHIQTETLLLRYAGEPLRLPQRGAPTPQLPFLRWHRKEVFRGPARAA
jgi:putative restriction endonuclease